VIKQSENSENAKKEREEASKTDEKHILFVCTKCTLSKQVECMNSGPKCDDDKNDSGVDIEDLVQKPIRNGRQLYQDIMSAHEQEDSETQNLENLEIRKTRCLAICDDGCAIALTGPDKFSYQFGKIDHTDPESVTDILKFTKYYVEAKDDAVTKKGQRPPRLRRNLYARIPPKSHFSEFIPE
jgi:predicted metal-binding protein